MARSLREYTAKPSLEDKNRPAGIDRPAAVDDLKLISGVGPKIEGVLHTLGIFTFAQVASWKKAEREWVDGYLSFHGRIDRTLFEMSLRSFRAQGSLQPSTGVRH